MSDSDCEDSPCPRWFDLESDLPQNSFTDSAIRIGVNVGVLFANQTQTGALVHGDSSIAGPASHRGALQ